MKTVCLSKDVWVRIPPLPPNGDNMSKRIEINGKFYRKRRGVLVEIPEEWVGKTVEPQTIRKRKSKGGQGRKFKRKVQR